MELIKTNFIGTGESDAAKVNTNYLFGKQILKYDLATGKFFWAADVNVKVENN
jgi:hypothetical protein